MAGQHMADFVADDGGELILRGRDFQQAGIDTDLAARQRESIDLLGVEHLHLPVGRRQRRPGDLRSEEHTSELQSLMRISYAVFCLKKKKNTNKTLPLTNSPLRTDET